MTTSGTNNTFARVTAILSTFNELLINNSILLYIMAAHRLRASLLPIISLYRGYNYGY